MIEVRYDLFPVSNGTQTNAVRARALSIVFLSRYNQTCVHPIKRPVTYLVSATILIISLMMIWESAMCIYAAVCCVLYAPEHSIIA